MTGIWQSAKDTADNQLRELYDVLHKSGDPVLNEVADEIAGVLESYRVGIMRALLAVDQAAPEARDAIRVAACKAVAEARARLLSDKHVIAADTNPFGVTVGVGAILSEALTSLDGRLSS